MEVQNVTESRAAYEALLRIENKLGDLVKLLTPPPAPQVKIEVEPEKSRGCGCEWCQDDDLDEDEGCDCINDSSETAPKLAVNVLIDGMKVMAQEVANEFFEDLLKTIGKAKR